MATEMGRLNSSSIDRERRHRGRSRRVGNVPIQIEDRLRLLRLLLHLFDVLGGDLRGPLERGQVVDQLHTFHHFLLVKVRLNIYLICTELALSETEDEMDTI